MEAIVRDSRMEREDLYSKLAKNAGLIRNNFCNIEKWFGAGRENPLFSVHQITEASGFHEGLYWLASTRGFSLVQKSERLPQSRMDLMAIATRLTSMKSELLRIIRVTPMKREELHELLWRWADLKVKDHNMLQWKPVVLHGRETIKLFQTVAAHEMFDMLLKLAKKEGITAVSLAKSSGYKNSTLFSKFRQGDPAYLGPFRVLQIVMEVTNDIRPLIYLAEDFNYDLIPNRRPIRRQTQTLAKPSTLDRHVMRVANKFNELIAVLEQEQDPSLFPPKIAQGMNYTVRWDELRRRTDAFLSWLERNYENDELYRDISE